MKGEIDNLTLVGDVNTPLSIMDRTIRRSTRIGITPKAQEWKYIHNWTVSKLQTFVLQMILSKKWEDNP